MKRYMLLLVFCVSCLMAVGAEISKDDLERLERTVKIGSISDDTLRGDDGEKSEILKFYTYQNEDDAYNFRMRVTLEITDKSKNTYFASLNRERGAVDVEYTGEDNWQFALPHGELEKPKLTAYAVQYGILNDGKFIVLAEEFDDVDTQEELTERTTTRADKKLTATHNYSYRDGDDEVVQSPWK